VKTIKSMLAGIARKRHVGALESKHYKPDMWESGLATQDLQKVYDAQGWSGALGQWRQRNLDRLVANIRELHQSHRRAVTLLDVACFSGDYFGRLIEVPGVGESLQYTGVDVTPKYVHNAATRWSNHPNAGFQVASALDLPFPNGAFDIVFNSGMLIHIDDPRSAIANFARVAGHRVIVETTVDHDQERDFIDENKSGPDFIDRVYRTAYIRGLINDVATVTRETEVPYQKHVSILFEAAPRAGGGAHA
jgi:ubiquinone/menaquinone biosynthesis C-methylase UbiE